MMKLAHDQDQVSLSPRQITQLPDDPALLKGLLRDQTAHIHTLQQHLTGPEPQHHAQKMEAISTLAGGIAHEFNNILAAMLGFTELTQNLMPEGSTAWDNLEEVNTAGQRAKELVQQVLAFSRPLATDPKPLLYTPLITEVIASLSTSLAPGIELQQHIAPDLGWVLADRTRMHHIIRNLWSNATQAMRNMGGVLDISAQPFDVTHLFASQHPPLEPGSHIQLTVRDTGAGIDPDILPRIFDPFFTTKDVGQGTGMGLAIVHGIIMSHQGAITIESTPGEGSAFTIYLPQVTPPECTTRSGNPSVSSGTHHQMSCVLFVDDEKMLAQAAQKMLQRLGYEADIVTNPQDALARFQAAPERYTLVITDQTMPKMTGIQLARQLRKIRADISIILCTGYSPTLNPTTIQEFGLNGFLMKPFGTCELETTIRQALAPSSLFKT